MRKQFPDNQPVTFAAREIPHQDRGEYSPLLRGESLQLPLKECLVNELGSVIGDEDRRLSSQPARYIYPAGCIHSSND